jgi:hypothetical protein
LQVTWNCKANENIPTLIRGIHDLKNMNRHTWREGDKWTDWLTNFSFNLNAFDLHVMETLFKKYNKKSYIDWKLRWKVVYKVHTIIAHDAWCMMHYGQVSYRWRQSLITCIGVRITWPRVGVLKLSFLRRTNIHYTISSTQYYYQGRFSTISRSRSNVKN